ncbi:cytochrome b5 domain-containing protein [Candidatus Pyrohabitans sp.]
MKTFTREELKKYNGLGGNPACVAYKGRVYDVSESALWEIGSHMALHLAGYDLTEAVKEAPHDASRLDRFPVVGVLKD